MTKSHVSRVLINSSIKMATKLQIKCTEDGVENKNDWEQLKNMNCDLGQGFFMAKPMSFTDFLQYRNENRKT